MIDDDISVPLETSEKLKGWPGPVLAFSMSACANLRQYSFIVENRKDGDDFHVAVRPKPPYMKKDGYSVRKLRVQLQPVSRSNLL
ncbi:unnamed protein product [Allacma fusca]|uniref:Uncharacterized protein n=1 Tax=Allacma fusca TaxID=39272 RepID=A0A8J2PBM3_9HEXA|nr:unnamed protein product [Allacma fusca]